MDWTIQVRIDCQCVACIRLCFIGPCQVQQEGGPGLRYNRKEVPGSSTLIMLVVHAYPMPLFSEAGDKETSSAGLPPHQSNLGKAPSRPLQVHTPPLAKMQIETRLGGNRTAASDSRSEAIDWSRGGCGDHFGLFRASLRAELETSAGQLPPLL